MQNDEKISPELLRFMALHQLSIEQLLAIKDHILLNMHGFGYRMLLQVLALRERQ